MAYSVAIANRKGGVGKTTLTVNLGAALAQKGKRVLLIDTDASGDLTKACGIDLQDGDITTYEVIMRGIRAQDAVRRITRETTGAVYDVMPADDAMEDVELVSQDTLRNALAPIAGSYDYILIDTPPTFGTASIQALTAAQGVLIPANAVYYSLDAVAAIAERVQEMRKELNPALKILGVVLTNYNARIGHNRDVHAVLEDALPGAIFAAYTTQSIVAAEAPADGVDVYEYTAKHKDRRTRAMEQYSALADELIERVEGNGTEK